MHIKLDIDVTVPEDRQVATNCQYIGSLMFRLSPSSKETSILFPLTKAKAEILQFLVSFPSKKYKFEHWHWENFWYNFTHRVAQWSWGQLHSSWASLLFSRQCLVSFPWGSWQDTSHAQESVLWVHQREPWGLGYEGNISIHSKSKAEHRALSESVSIKLRKIRGDNSI